MTKYRAVPTTIDNIRFASKAEARRYTHLKFLFKSGVNRNLELQPKFKIRVEGKDICTYRADFAYFENGKRVIEDVKGVLTPVYRLKKKLVEAIYKVEIRETK